VGAQLPIAPFPLPCFAQARRQAARGGAAQAGRRRRLTEPRPGRGAAWPSGAHMARPRGARHAQRRALKAARGGARARARGGGGVPARIGPVGGGGRRHRVQRDPAALGRAEAAHGEAQRGLVVCARGGRRVRGGAAAV